MTYRVSESFPVKKYLAELLAALFQDRGHILEVHRDCRPFHELRKSLFYAFARDDATKCCDDRLPFFRQRPIDEQRRGMGMRRAARQHQVISRGKKGLEADPVDRGSIRLEVKHGMSGKNNGQRPLTRYQ